MNLPRSFGFLLSLAVVCLPIRIEAAASSATIGKTADGKPLVDVAVPPGVDKTLVAPRTGEALDRAMLPLDKILSQIERPAYLPKAGSAANTDPVEAADKRIAELKATLEAKPKDRAASAELITLHLVQKDDPAGALPYLEAGADPKTRVHLPLAAKAVDQLKESELMDLAIWYQDLGTKTQGPAGVTMLRRAYGYYERFIKAHTDQDLANSTAKVALLKVHQAIEARAAGGGMAGRVPSLHVQRTYARARAAWREGQPHVAINLLEAANNLAPNQPDILRLLGQIYFTDLRNAVQGAHYLKQVIAIEPGDLDSLFLLGRYEFLHLRQYKSAIAVFAHALTVTDKDADPAIPLLAHHYLGRALQNEGYDAASIDEFEKFLAAADRLGRPTKYMQEVALFTRTLPVAWQQVGDAHHRLNNPQAALVAYNEALTLDPDERENFISRIAYSQLRLGQGEQALKAVVELVKDTGGDKAALQLLKYLVDAGASATKLTGELKRIYEQLDRPAALAVAVANMQGGDEGRKTLREHLLARPGDREVFQSLLEQYFAKPEKSQTADAVRLTVDLIARLPAAAERYGELMLDAAAASPATGKPDVLAAIEAFDAAEQAKPVVRLIKAMALLRAGKDDAAIEEYAKAAAADPSLILAQASLVKMLADRGEYERAAKVLAGIKDEGDIRIIPLRIRILRETKKVEEAKKLLEGLTPMQLRGPDIALERAKFQLLDGDVAAAVRTLEDSLEANPGSEDLYDAILSLLDGDETIDAQRQFARLADRMVRQFPRSKAARYRKAQLFIKTGEFPQAELLAREVQKEDPTDVRTLAMLTQILFFTERKPEADELVNVRLKDHPRSEEVTAVALQLARLHLQSGSPARSIELLTALLDNKAMIKDPRPLVSLTRLAMVRAKKFDNIDEVFKKVVAGYPEHWADLMSDWALTWEYAGQKTKSEKLLEEILTKAPDHPKTNNALGYSWADQGKNLEKAEKMIAIALKSDPESSAYLDSMGWVKYKLGLFDEAVKYLEKARVEDGGDHAVILDHLADALYRAGRQIEALQWWQKAQQSIDPRELDIDPELKGVSAKLREKIGAVRTAKEPPLADVPSKVKRQDDEKDDKKDKKDQKDDAEKK